MTTPATPLLLRGSTDVVAILHGRPVTGTEFLSHANGLAATLPAAGAVVNICKDRYHFLIGFAAALANGMTTLLPQNPLGATVNGLIGASSGCFVLADTPGHRFDARIVLVDATRHGPPTNVLLPPGQLAAIAFTSGTTGTPAAHLKTWRALTGGTDINLNYYLPPGTGPWSVVATVPAQHMYGLETTILPPLRGPTVLNAGRPFFPADVSSALEEMPAPRILVSTPVHLRALVGAGLRFPPMARILSATAPMDPTLAAEVEDAFGCELIEIYGCSEVGSMASRRPGIGANWQFFKELRFDNRAGSTWISAEHLEGQTRIPDVLRIQDDGAFTLVGRDTDLVKIGGKRASLADITRLILAVRGVRDAVVFPKPGALETDRLVAMIVADNVGPTEVRHALLSVLDPELIPRPILLLKELPRSAIGKITQEATLRLYHEVTGSAQL